MVFINLANRIIINLSIKTEGETMFSARNQLKVKIKNITSGIANSVVTASLKDQVLKATITLESEKRLGLKEGDEVLFMFKAFDVLIATKDDLNTSASNDLAGVVLDVSDGVVSSEVAIEVTNGVKIVAVITKESSKNLRLKKGSKVRALIKATNIIVAKK